MKWWTNDYKATGVLTARPGRDCARLHTFALLPLPMMPFGGAGAFFDHALAGQTLNPLTRQEMAETLARRRIDAAPDAAG